ncbi:hypothetical protein TSUD_55350 [Trifolium subterraneum]|uniref:Uncharacterized protein n=1 Tax=Trifolium subterraneum TaxID=3900 RepID=A0A2Z6M5M8_TRISU|nr:hypothetical protein TSUD_55350 [Trifolium subterraneum]
MLEKRSVEDGSDPVRKRSRADLTISGLREEVPVGVPTKKFILPGCISYRELLDVNTEVQVSPADIAIINDMGPASIKKSLMEDTMAVMRVLEIANTLNARDSRYLEDVERLRKKVSELKGEIAKVENDYSNYKEKYVVQEDFITELGQKVNEINTLKGSNESLTLELYMLVEEKITLENDLRLANEKVSTLAEEKEKLESFLKSFNSWPQVGDVSLEEGSNELKNFDRFALIAKIRTLENELLTSAQESFDNALAQVKCLNPEVEFKTAGMSLLKLVKDGHLKAPEGYVDDEEAKDV